MTGIAIRVENFLSCLHLRQATRERRRGQGMARRPWTAQEETGG